MFDFIFLSKSLKIMPSGFAFHFATFSQVCLLFILPHVQGFRQPESFRNHSRAGCTVVLCAFAGAANGGRPGPFLVCFLRGKATRKKKAVFLHLLVSFKKSPFACF